MTHSASDVERYAYCPMSWWLSVHGVSGKNDSTRRGVEEHARAGRALAAVRRALEREATWSSVAVNLALFAASAAVLAAEIVWLDVTTRVGGLVLIVSLLWTVLSLASLLRGILHRRKAEDVSARAGVLAEPVVYSDLDRPGDLLVSKRWDLAGRPDYIVERNGARIPVEVKTGRAPQRPHESHTLQMGAYLLLLEEQGARPPYGVLQYPGRQFEVPYTDELRDRVLETLLRMQVAAFAGEARRNHENPRKCLGCSRRAGCAARLA